MPCPYFEPLTAMTVSDQISIRLPLIEQYDGLCHASSQLTATPGPERLRCCNQGYSQGVCDWFPLGEGPAAIRYTVVSRSQTEIQLLCVEERDFAPLKWHRLGFRIVSGELEPEELNLMRSAQARAFCRSYLQRFPA